MAQAPVSGRWSDSVGTLLEASEQEVESHKHTVRNPEERVPPTTMKAKRAS